MRKRYGVDLSQVSDANRLKILGMILENGSISRTQLAQLSGLSLPAVSRIVTILIEQGYVREAGFGGSNGGRKPVLLEPISQAGFVIGADLGGSSVRAALVDLNGQIIEVTEQRPQGEPIIQVLLNVIHETIQQLDLGQRKRLLGIGVGTPGLIDYSSGVVLTAANLGWKNFPLRERLENEYHLPIFVDNDANVAALAEWTRGAGQKTAHMVYLTISRGFGAGFILDGKIYRGATGTAGEIGDTFWVLSKEVPSGWHTLEDLCSGRALESQALAAIRQGESSLLCPNRDSPATSIPLEAIFEAARQGDGLATRLVNAAADYLSMGIANLVNIMDPELVIIGGAFSQAGDLLLEPINRALDRLLPPLLRQKVKVTTGVLGERAGVLGAASLVLHHAFMPPIQHNEAVSLLPI